MSSFTAIGRSARRVEGREKVTGTATYVADVQPRGAACARLVLSPHAHARIKSVDVGAALKVPGVIAAFSGKDLGGADILAVDEVYFAGEAVAVVVGEDEAAAEDGADAVRVEYEPLPVVSDPVAAMRPDSPLTREDNGTAHDDAGAHGAAVGGSGTRRPKPRNVNQMVEFQRGDMAKAWAEADVVLEDTYRIARVHQGYLETQGSVAERAPGGGFTVWTTTQAAFGARDETAKFLGVPAHQVNVIATQVGGGFGGKFVLVEPLAAALARRVRRPVRVILDRTQDFLVSHPSPAAVIRLKMGATRDGTLTGIEAELIFDAGCAPGAPVGIAALLLGGTYRCPNLDIVGYEVLTHKVAVGAYRAPGAPQAYYALESHMSRLADRLGLDAIDFRLRNAVKEGDSRPDGRPWPRIGLVECLERARAHPMWRNRGSLGPDEGVGVAVGGWGGGTEPATGGCRVNPDGSLTVQVGSVDITGVNTTFALIAAEVFGIPPDKVQIATNDTDHAPYAGASGGSKTTYTVGAAVLAAAEDARNQVLEMAADRLEAAVSDLEMADGRVFVKGAPNRGVTIGELARLANRFGSRYKPLHGQGRSAVHTSAPGFAVHLCKVRVDRLTGMPRVTGYVAVQDVGRALNPAEVIGQIRGGVAQGIGRALFESMVHDDSGQLLNATLADYALPTAADLPDIEVELVEVPSALGPFGAKGVGEPPAVPGPAAVANAVEAAVGVRITSVPISPEAVLDGLEGGTGR
jgi:CO/xanthine dehydrogenase Mo-binding subunit